MPYNLGVQGYIDFARYAQVVDQRKISRDPLSGLVDGINTVFNTTYSPLLTSGSLQVYTSGSLVSGVADYNTGEITLSAAPSVQPKATYSFTPYTTDQILQFLTSGFDEMELRWDREWRLVDFSGNPASETSDALLVVDSSGSDSTCGTTTFSASRTQIAFFMACVEYRFRLTQFGTSVDSDYMYKSTGGVTVDKSKRPGNFDALMRQLDERVKRALRVAQEQFYPDMSHMGTYVSPPMSSDYAINYEWQTAAQNNNPQLALGYNISLRPF